MIDSAKKWMEKAQEDISAAKVLLDNKRYLYAFFFCQQAIEKAVKSVIIRRTGEFPPKIHNLARLFEIADVVITEDQKTFLRELTQFYIESRYPEEISKLGMGLNKRLTTKTVRRTAEYLQWLDSIR